jgi:hypothetical protein
MLRFGKRQREVWIDTLSQAANVAAGGLLFGQFVGDRPFSTKLGCAGIAAWIILLLWSTFLARDRAA